MTKSKQWLCKLIVLVILLVGMCDEEVRADSVFAFPQTMSGMVQEVSKAVLTDVELESMELLCTRNTVTGSQIITQLTNGRRTIKLSMFFLCITINWLLLSNFYGVGHIAEFPQLRVRTAVIHYIHNTDGKK